MFQGRRQPARWKQAGSGVLLGAAGAGLVVALMQLPKRLDTVLLLSTAFTNVTQGLKLFGLGLLEVAGVVLLVALAVGALVLVAAGVVRIVRSISRPRR